ncbi:type II toxin-antitoxin system Phd/YefM family antitoxin [Actinosynnema sp. CA-248983]
MKSIAVTEFRRDPKAYVARASAGERIRITRWGKPVAVLTPPSPHETLYDRLVLSGELVPATTPRHVLLGGPWGPEAQD